MSLAKRRNIAHQNPVHFLLEELAGDRKIRTTLWNPMVSFNTNNISSELPTRTITIDHPTKLPFFGEFVPQV